MRTFFFHLESPDGIERDECGIACDGVERAYLEACRAIPEITSTLLQERRNPHEYSFLIENADGQHLLTVPFTEQIQSSPQQMRDSQLRAARRLASEGAERLRHQRTTVAAARALGMDTRLSEQLCAVFEQILVQHYERLERLEKKDRDTVAKGRKQNTAA